VVDQPPAYLDLRLGNLCNLKCRMCNPYNSVQIEKEWAKIDQKTQNNYSKFWNKYGLEFGGCTPWYESENFWKGVEENIPYLKKVYMTGGEPTLIEGNYRFLDRCRETGYAKKIELFFNINFTNLKDRFIEQLNDFHWASVNASLDGYGIVNEYIRAPSRWSVIDKNFRKLAEQAGRRGGFGNQSP
jgi:sulfatase maturation enzyme AslB (radical SAM superfamily)